MSARNGNAALSRLDKARQEAKNRKSEINKQIREDTNELNAIKIELREIDVVLAIPAAQRAENYYQELLAKKKTANTRQAFLELSSEFLKLEQYKDAKSLSEECVQLATASRYNALLSQKDQTTTEEQFLQLSNDFAELGDYENAPALAEECKQKHLALKAEREQRERELEERYQKFLTLKNKAKTETEFQSLAGQFREFGAYQNAESLARECEQKCQEIREKRRKKNRGIAWVAVIAILLAGLAAVWMFTDVFDDLFSQPDPTPAPATPAPAHTPAPTPPPPPFGLHDLALPFARGTSGEEVQRIQEYLNDIGAFFPGSIRSLQTDGIFGPNTEGAVTEFQELVGLRTDGIVDLDTWYMMLRKHANPSTFAHAQSDLVGVWENIELRGLNPDLGPYDVSWPSNPSRWTFHANGTGVLREYNAGNWIYSAFSWSEENGRLTITTVGGGITIRDYAVIHESYTFTRLTEDTIEETTIYERLTVSEIDLNHHDLLFTWVHRRVQ